MLKPKVLLVPGEDTPAQKPPLVSTEDQTQERVYVSENMAMQGDSVESDVTEQNSEGYLKILDKIQAKSSSIFEFSLQFDDVVASLEKKEERLRVVEMKEKEIGLLEESISRRLSVLEEKEIETDLRLVIEASIMRLVLEKQSEDLVTQLKTEENKLGLFLRSTTKKLEELVSEFDGRKEEACRVSEKLCELEKAEKEFHLKQRAETERRNEESEAREKDLRALEEAVKEKTAELKRKEETLELKMKEEAEKLREETELMRKGLEIKEKTLEKRLKELELKQMELEETSRPQLVEAESRKRSNLEIEPPLLVKNDSDADSCTPQAKKQKSQEANDGDIEGIVCTDKSYEDPNSLTCPDTKLNDFSKSMSSFAVDQVWALYDPRDDMPRNYAQIREIFESQLSLQVTLLEHVKTTKDEQSILSGCGRFEYGDTEIKSHLMFAHEMDHIKSAEEVIVNPRKGETWALFSDWNASWNSHLELQELPYRYDFVEVISEFDDLIGIQVAYMGRVEGYESVFNHAEQYGCIKIVIPPAEMQRFSHKVESVKLSGKEEEGIPFRSFKLNPAAMPRYYHVLEEVVETEIQIKDPTVVHQNGSTKDLPIIID
ncbi:putative E3 ubiquitin-protein ligase/polycomb group RING finger protein [Arabidopsis thaliana]|uniref:Trichohyalin-like protein (DUF3444) n=4 Tax=Arabidopsis TaxID=3701 RepID=A0A178V2L1_ARATH|nr:trichohyalin-like protein (DUF3444) [Arabidopsis thaliana]KAG7617609.1 hypothetical protein ISN45_At04g029530 [Arabidopsis thaliana x Arabidopsis arenosa]KAG7622067.1 hypothetical protein ISN44_As04g028960 [Arabidopsis suecica]ANM66728.1 trichohyalin-like protein (DUF3444) [Arabidopsis thaliana]OAP00449.1 hypothetical protein AXX17_AT4G32210 [Arabidopsis thaliana]CAD5329301.1 unnamed protein product [Arabidopsis thaliana]|eukprot:NP_001328606.1 trichohyalin-like protein (DUF3444) [Arabidopsis thaliana]